MVPKGFSWIGVECHGFPSDWSRNWREIFEPITIYQCETKLNTRYFQYITKKSSICYCHYAISCISLNRCLLFLQTEQLQNELKQALEKNEQSSPEIDDEGTKEDETGHENLASLLSAEKERVEEITKEWNSLKCSLEKLENRKDILENEATNTQKELQELRERMKDLESQLLDSKQTCEVSKDQLKEERGKCQKIVKEFNEYKSNQCRSKDSSGNVSFEVELQKAKKQSEELVKELTEEKKLNETLRWEFLNITMFYFLYFYPQINAVLSHVKRVCLAFLVRQQFSVDGETI